jgi:hypothetical protein
MTNAEDDRLKRPADEARAPRAMFDRAIAEDRELSDSQRVSMLRNEFRYQALPDPPETPGWKYIWLSTTNQSDPIHARIRLGYVPVKPEDLPGFQFSTVKTGDYEGMIGVNEMLLFRIPIDRWTAYMRELHHDAPLEEEGRLSSAVESIRSQAEAAGGRVLAGDGFQELGRSVRPRF